MREPLSNLINTGKSPGISRNLDEDSNVDKNDIFKFHDLYYGFDIIEGFWYYKENILDVSEEWRYSSDKTFEQGKQYFIDQGGAEFYSGYFED